MILRSGTGAATRPGVVLTLAVLLCACAVPLALGGRAEMKAPGEGSSRRPPLGGRTSPDYLALARRPGESATAAPFTLLLEFYRVAISPVDGDRCDMAPTCSLYARQAFQEYGGLLGFLLTADRLLHEADERPLVRTYTLGREKYYVDPPRANTYWWQGDGR